MAHVLVTGAGGFVGRAVVRHLRATGTCVRAGTRGGAPVDDAPGVRLDVTDRASCDRAMDGIDSVVHCAVGAAAVTIGGTRTVLAAASAALAWPGPWFLERTPHGYHDVNAIQSDLRAAGWTDIRIETVALAGRAASARSAAVALCQGTPMRDELAALGEGAVATATEAATAAIARVFGDGSFEAAHQAHIVEASR